MGAEILTDLLKMLPFLLLVFFKKEEAYKTITWYVLIIKLSPCKAALSPPQPQDSYNPPKAQNGIKQNWICFSTARSFLFLFHLLKSSCSVSWRYKFWTHFRWTIHYHKLWLQCANWWIWWAMKYDSSNGTLGLNT